MTNPPPMTDDLVGRLRADAVWQRKLRGGTTNEAMLDEAAARIEALEAALRPFASLDVLEPNGVVIGLERWHFERARAALTLEAPHAD